MDPIYRQLHELLAQNQPLAFAVLVETKGSTPQKCGAKAIFLPDGRVLGTLGGGCLEAETRQKALRALETGEKFSFRAVLDDDFGWDDGLICGGAVQTFVEPNPKSREIWNELLAEKNPRQRKMLVTVIESPRRDEIGARALFADENPLKSDAISDELLQKIGKKSAEILQEHEPEPQLSRISDAISVYFEPILPKPTLIICGGGHVGAATGKLAAWAGFDVVAIDDRASFANKERFPDAAKIIVDDPAKAVKNFPIDEDTYIVIVTRGHRHDAVVLREVIHSKAAYIGMIGSKRKVRTIMDGFIEEGAATAEDFMRIYSPVGLDINSVTIEEIAISIVSQLIAVRRGKHDVKPLSVTQEIATKIIAKTAKPTAAS
jgi:xanthine dehydrogenase accessory factor